MADGRRPTTLFDWCIFTGFRAFFLHKVVCRPFVVCGPTASLPFVLSPSRSHTERTKTQPFFRRINPPEGRRTTPCGPSRIAGGNYTGSSDFLPFTRSSEPTVFKFYQRLRSDWCGSVLNSIWELSTFSYLSPSVATLVIRSKAHP